jgi:hypothetical protein
MQDSLATKDDLKMFKTELTAEMAQLKVDLTLRVMAVVGLGLVVLRLSL